MHVKSIALSNFRSFERRRFEFSPDTTIVFGPNGSGKSNLLEAIAYCALPRSVRGCPDAGLVRWGAEQFSVDATVSGPNGECEVSVRWGVGADGAPHKTVTLDGKRVTRWSALSRALVTLTFRSSDHLFVDGEPSLRRRFIDRF